MSTNDHSVLLSKTQSTSPKSKCLKINNKELTTLKLWTISLGAEADLPMFHTPTSTITGVGITGILGTTCTYLKLIILQSKASAKQQLFHISYKQHSILCTSSCCIHCVLIRESKYAEISSHTVSSSDF